MELPSKIAEKVNMFNDSSLFSNHYLENMIQKVPEWDDVGFPTRISGACFIPGSKNMLDKLLMHVRDELNRIPHTIGCQGSDYCVCGYLEI